MKITHFQIYICIYKLEYLKKVIHEYTGCPKLNDFTLKSFTNETILEKIVKFCVGHNEGMGIYLRE